ncbi:MAG: hypothetical protein KF822_12500 [Steroidobacteraceae bacterium]|nr:hypothetical protein [Steroidobacteraceae bacterium]
MARLTRSNKGTKPVLLTGERTQVILDNRKRTKRLIIAIAGTLTVAGGPAGAVRNGGRLSTIYSHAVNENGEDTWGPNRAYMVRQLAEMRAAQPLAAETLPPSGALPIGVYPLFEEYAINFGYNGQVGPSETDFIERDPSSFLTLDTFLTPGFNAVTTLVAPAGGSTVTLSNLTVRVTQEFAELDGATLPVFKPRAREQVQPVAGTVAAELNYIKTQNRLRALIWSQEAVIGADGGVIVDTSVIMALRVIGDGGFNVIGPNQVPFRDLVDSQRLDFGGDVTWSGGIFGQDFAYNARLANTLFPAIQAPNFRGELAVQLSTLPGATTSRTVQLIEELTRPEGTVGPLPEWAQTVAA